MKNKARKLLLLMMIMSTVLAFSACGNTGSETITATGQAETAASTESIEESVPEREQDAIEPENTNTEIGMKDIKETESTAPETEGPTVENTEDNARIVYDDREAFASDKNLSSEKITKTASVTQDTNSASTDFLTPEGYLNPNNPIVAAAYAKYGENIAISEDGTVLDASTWQILGQIDGVPSASENNNSSFLTDGYDRTAAEEVWKCMNEERVAEGREPLAWDEDIYNFACQRAVQLVTDFSHNGCGNYGENIHYRTGIPYSGESIHMSWYYSPAHHANYLDSRYGSGACAVYVYNGSVYAVENFALASASNSQTTEEPENTESELIGEIDNGTYWTASNGVTLFIRGDGMVSVTMSNEHTPEECKVALDEYNTGH